MLEYQNTDIEVRSDGVYVLINKKSINIKNDILKVIQKYDVKDVNYDAIEIAIKDRKDEQLISLNKNIKIKDESIEVTFSSDKLVGKIKFVEPDKKGKTLTVQEIENLIDLNGIKYGVDHEIVSKLSREKLYGRWYDVAFGKKPVNGINGYIEYFFETEKKSLKPKVRDDGTVDYKSINLFDAVIEGQKLAVAHPPVLHQDGMNVQGKVIPAVRAKNTPPLPKGKNTAILEDKVTLVAEISGRISYVYGKVNILPILEINGNVDNETGNIDFIGSVIIKGNVISGFTVNAGADIEINGSVESATIKSGGNITLLKGVQGANKAIIEAEGDINANFIENAILIAGGNIIANSIMHSVVKCGKGLTLMGHRGLFVGGKAVVGNQVEAKVIGSMMSTVTEIEVGFDPIQLEKYKENVKLVEEYTQRYKSNEKLITVLSKIRDELSVDKKKILIEAIRSKILIKTKINELQAQISKSLSELNKCLGIIKAENIIHSGVKVTINNAVMFVKDDIQHCCLYNKDSKVCIGSYN